MSCFVLIFFAFICLYLNCGVRFSIKARIPFFWSLVANVLFDANCCLRVVSKAALTAFFANFAVICEKEAILSAVSIVLALVLVEIFCLLTPFFQLQLRI